MSVKSVHSVAASLSFPLYPQEVNRKPLKLDLKGHFTRLSSTGEVMCLKNNVIVLTPDKEYPDHNPSSEWEESRGSKENPTPISTLFLKEVKQEFLFNEQQKRREELKEKSAVNKIENWWLRQKGIPLNRDLSSQIDSVEFADESIETNAKSSLSKITLYANSLLLDWKDKESLTQTEILNRAGRDLDNLEIVQVLFTIVTNLMRSDKTRNRELILLIEGCLDQISTDLMDEFYASFDLIYENPPKNLTFKQEELLAEFISFFEFTLFINDQKFALDCMSYTDWAKQVLRKKALFSARLSELVNANSYQLMSVMNERLRLFFIQSQELSEKEQVELGKISAKLILQPLEISMEDQHKISLQKWRVEAAHKWTEYQKSTKLTQITLKAFEQEAQHYMEKMSIVVRNLDLSKPLEAKGEKELAVYLALIDFFSSLHQANKSPFTIHPDLTSLRIEIDEKRLMEKLKTPAYWEKMEELFLFNFHK